MRMLRTVLTAALLSMAATAGAAAQSFPDRGRNAVVDAASVIPDDVEDELNAAIVAWNRSTGHQLVVATVPSLQGYQIQDYGYRLLRHWGLGRAGINDGAILLLAPSEREVRIEVGYGLEPVLTDALSGAIIRESIRPALRAGDVPGALAAGAKRIMQATTPGTADAAGSQPAKAASQQAEPPFPLGFSLTIGGAIGGIAFLIWLSRRSRKARRSDTKKSRDERRYATVPRAEGRARSGSARGGRQRTRGESSAPLHSSSNDPLAALQQRAQSHDSYSGYSDSSSWDSSSSSSSSSSDSGFDSGGGSSGGGGADSNY